MSGKIDTIIQQFFNEVAKLLGNRMKLVKYRTKVRNIACDIELDNDFKVDSSEKCPKYCFLHLCRVILN